MLLSARIFCGYRGVFPMQIFARRKSKAELSGELRISFVAPGVWYLWMT